MKRCVLLVSNNNLSGFRDSVDVPANSKVGDCFGEHEVIIFKHPNPSRAKVANFSGISALADSIKDNGALLVLSLKQNGLGTKEAGRVLGDMLKANSVLKELDLSSNFVHPDDGGDAPGFVQELAVGIKDNRALSSLNLASNSIGTCDIIPGGWIYDPTPGKYSYQNVSLNKYQNETPAGSKSSGLIALTKAVKDMRAISSVNVLFNNIGAEQAHALANVLKEHATLKSLCGNKGNETELGMSGKKIGADGAIMLAPEIADNGALSSLNLASNHLCGINEYGQGTYDASGNACFHSHI
jgi:hypothetical protein